MELRLRLRRFRLEWGVADRGFIMINDINSSSGTTYLFKQNQTSASV